MWQKNIKTKKKFFQRAGKEIQEKTSDQQKHSCGFCFKTIDSK